MRGRLLGKMRDALFRRRGASWCNYFSGSRGDWALCLPPVNTEQMRCWGGDAAQLVRGLFWNIRKRLGEIVVLVSELSSFVAGRVCVAMLRWSLSCDGSILFILRVKGMSGSINDSIGVLFQKFEERWSSMSFCARSEWNSIFGESIDAVIRGCVNQWWNALEIHDDNTHLVIFALILPNFSQI